MESGHPHRPSENPGQSGGDTIRLGTGVAEPNEKGSMTPTILVVDDDPDDRESAARVLGSKYDVDLAVDAEEARAKLNGSAPDLLLCDIYLPGESGMKLAESILGSYAKQTDIVMVTGDADQALAERALELGVYGYLVKPFRDGDLLITVSNALRRRTLERQVRALIVLKPRTPSDPAAERILDQMEAETGIRPVERYHGGRTYYLTGSEVGEEGLDGVLDDIEPGWRDILRNLPWPA
jgi:DNA-binding response OmpR family regulator